MHRRTVPAVLVVLCLLPGSAAFAKKDKGGGIGPGPTVISAEEAAIVADPENGIEHAVILVEETDRDESFRTTNEIIYHFRAKILSNEARGLGDVTIPYNVRNGRLKEWWAHTILPDGTVHTLAEDDLEEQLVEKGASSMTDYVKLKGALPGIEAGAVIDYGYRFQADGALGFGKIPIQREYLVRKFQFRWVPFERANYLVTHEKERGVVTTKDKRSITFTAENVPPVVDEPFGPPRSELQAVLYIYYNLSEIYEPRAFWDFQAKQTEKFVADFMKGEKKLQEALDEIPLPEDGDLHAKLEALYDWIDANIENTDYRTSERRESEARADQDEDDFESVRQVWKDKAGTAGQIRLLYAAFARLLGADAHLAAVVDRSEAYWDARLLTGSQFDTFLIAVKGPDEPDESYVVVDPGSGLPYGKVRWWFSMIRGLLCTEEGAGSVTIPPLTAGDSTTVYDVDIRFEDDGELIASSWTMTAAGQWARGERVNLRGLSPEEREDRLFELCGSGGDLEVTSATVSDLEDFREPLVVTCEAEEFTDGIADDDVRYAVAIAGPWIGSLPTFVKETRESPILFRHPWTTETTVNIHAPDGFKPAGGHPPVSADTALGQFRLTILPSGEIYQVKRKFVMPLPSMAAKHYEGLMKYFDFIKRADATRIEFVRISGS